MKPALTNELKARFFAQYWGQDVTNSGIPAVYPVVACNMYRIEESCLLLKPLSAISDEDAAVLSIHRYKNSQSLLNPHIGKCIVDGYLTKGRQLEPFEVDYLRSKSYFLPFMDYSEELIHAGWVKLQEVQP